MKYELNFSSQIWPDPDERLKAKIMGLEASNIKLINSPIPEININDIVNFQNVNISNLTDVSKNLNKFL